MKSLATSAMLDYSVFSQYTWSMIQWFQLFPLVVFLRKISICFIAGNKSSRKALVTGIIKCNFANLSTSDKNVSEHFFSKIS